MELEQKKEWLIHAAFLALILLLGALFLKFLLPLLSPFVVAFGVAYLLRKPIVKLGGTRLGEKGAAVLLVLLFYSTVGLLFTLLLIRLFAGMRGVMVGLPDFYTAQVAPLLWGLAGEIERSLVGLDPAMTTTLQELVGQFAQSLAGLVSNLSVGAVARLSQMASSLPGAFIRTLLTIISTFFIAADYQRLTNFCLRQLDERTKGIALQVKNYLMGTLFVCVRSYGVILVMTFLEIWLGLTLLQVPGAVVIGCIIAVFDILPVLGSGGVLIPWMVIVALQGNYLLAVGLLLLYLVVVVVRNIVEPRLVGGQIGLHPVVTLASMFVGAQLLGGLGLFGFPIGLSLLGYLNDCGTIHLFRPEGKGEGVKL